MPRKGQPVLVATLSDVRHFATLLRAVAFQTRVILTLSSAGICVTAEESRTLQARVYIPSNIFTSYTLQIPSNNPALPASQDEDEDEDDERPPQDDDVSFELNLTQLLECLNIFGNAGSASASSAGAGGNGKRGWNEGDSDDDDDDGDGRGAKRWKGRKDRDGSVASTSAGGGGSYGKTTAGRLTWAGVGEPLQVLLTEEGGGPTTISSLGTSEADEGIELEDNSDPAMRIILQASQFLDGLRSIDSSSANVVFSSLDADQVKKDPYFTQGNFVGQGKKPGVDLRLEAASDWGTLQMDFVNKTCERREAFSFKFSKTLLSRCLKGLACSGKVSITVYTSGLLQIQGIAKPDPSSDPTSKINLASLSLAERERRKMLAQARKDGQLNDGIIDWRMMALEDAVDDDDI